VYKFLVVIRDESDAYSLLWLFFLPYLIGIRASDDLRPLAAMIAGIIALGLWHGYRSNGKMQTME
jgi:hypothetical protein